MLSSGAGYVCDNLCAAIASVTMPFCWLRQRELAAASMQSTWGPGFIDPSATPLRDPLLRGRRTPKRVHCSHAPARVRACVRGRTVLESFRGYARPGPLGVVWESVAIMQPWDFRLVDISIPVRLWHGERTRSCDSPARNSRTRPSRSRARRSGRTPDTSASQALALGARSGHNSVGPIACSQSFAHLIANYRVA